MERNGFDGMDFWLVSIFLLLFFENVYKYVCKWKFICFNNLVYRKK